MDIMILLETKEFHIFNVILLTRILKHYHQPPAHLAINQGVLNTMWKASRMLQN